MNPFGWRGGQTWSTPTKVVRDFDETKAPLRVLAKRHGYSIEGVRQILKRAKRQPVRRRGYPGQNLIGD